MEFFPKEMEKSEMTLEGVASKLTYFQEQLHLIHWQTSNYAEHKAIGKFYEYIFEFKDDVMEKLMGYMGKKPRAFKMAPLVDSVSCVGIVNDVKKWAYELQLFAGANNYSDVENLAQELSGQAAKTLYLLTLS